MTQIGLKRAYEPQASQDGWRVYIDRLWPRGLSHETFHYDVWEKDISPSTELREWFHADPVNRWNGFVERYIAELKSNPAMPNFLEMMKKHDKVTLLYSSHDTEHDNAHVVLKYLVNNFPEEFNSKISIQTPTT